LVCAQLTTVELTTPKIATVIATVITAATTPLPRLRQSRSGDDPLLPFRVFKVIHVSVIALKVLYLMWCPGSCISQRQRLGA
jgi:hypothetical protein